MRTDPAPPPIPLLIIVGLGIFIGSFWLIFGFLSVAVGTPWGWHVLRGILPGAAIILMVLLARRHPLPYGLGLVVLGLLPFTLNYLGKGLVLTALTLGLPVTLEGILFIVWAKVQARGNQRPSA